VAARLAVDPTRAETASRITQSVSAVSPPSVQFGCFPKTSNLFRFGQQASNRGAYYLSRPLLAWSA